MTSNALGNTSTTEPINILLLEDDEALALALTKNMKKRGHPCFWCADIHSFQQFLNDHTQTIQLVLMDLKLDNQSSLSFIQVARSRFPTAKIFMITGFASIATTVEAIKLGADDYLPKPVNGEDILNRYYGISNMPVELAEERLSPKRLEWEHIQKVLQENEGNISKTALELNMHRRTLQRKLQKKPSAH